MLLLLVGMDKDAKSTQNSKLAIHCRHLEKEVRNETRDLTVVVLVGSNNTLTIYYTLNV